MLDHTSHRTLGLTNAVNNMIIMNATDFCLVSWPEEGTVSIVPRSRLIGGVVAGATYSLKVERRTHQGKIIAVGMSGWGRHTFTKCDISS